MSLTVVGLGPGNREEMTPRALKVIRDSEVIAGYHRYLEQISDLLQDKTVISNGMKGELERCEAAVEQACRGKRVCVVSSGDAGIYGMASLVQELAAPHKLNVQVIAGVTAATSAAALLGAPLGHDFAVVSLSDLLTPWDLIERRLRMAAEGDFVLCIYNPASHSRKDTLKKACSILLESKLPQTPCGLARNIGREGEESRILTLGELADTPVDMFTTVVIGSSRTTVINSKLVTPRGYGERGDIR